MAAAASGVAVLDLCCRRRRRACLPRCCKTFDLAHQWRQYFSINASTHFRSPPMLFATKARRSASPSWQRHSSACPRTAASLRVRRHCPRALQVVRAAKVENGPKIAIAGITGAVGQEMLK